MFREHGEIETGAHQTNLQDAPANSAGPRLDAPVLQLLARPEARLTPTSLPPRQPGKAPPLNRRYYFVLSF